VLRKKPLERTAREFYCLPLTTFSQTSSVAQQDKLNDVVVVVILLQVRHHESRSSEALSVTGKIEAYAL
jgi:hypothetical protein